MSYRKEDHLPPPLRTCERCDHQFIPDRGWWQRVCEACIEVLMDEETQDDEEGET